MTPKKKNYKPYKNRPLYMLKYLYYQSDEERTAIITDILHISKDTERQAVCTMTAFYHKVLYVPKFYKNHNYWV
ncbi:MAG: hypothetical protein IKL21_05775 [Clostridia bacterium]|nr:hypothetical protein [Clostridia bacterium]